MSTTGIVTKIELQDGNTDLLHSIECRSATTGKSDTITIAWPLDTNIKRIPVLGEMVYLLKAKGPEGSAGGGAHKYYYITSVSLQHNINHNALPKGMSKRTGAASSTSYSDAESGNPESNSEKQFEFKHGFEEVADVASLQPFSGDVLIEGRFGQSIRLGYTPTNSDTSQTPSWTGSPTDPITIIRNTQNTGGWNKFVIEEVDDDDSSIYATSGQLVGLSQAHPYSLGVIPANLYGSPQVLINSDRVVLNARNERVVIAGSSDVNISTPVWKAAMDNMFTQIDEIKNELNALNNAVSSFATAGGVGNLSSAPGVANAPLASAGGVLKGQTAAIKARIAKITTELNLMKQ